MELLKQNPACARNGLLPQGDVVLLPGPCKSWGVCSGALLFRCAVARLRKVGFWMVVIFSAPWTVIHWMTSHLDDLGKVGDFP